MTLPLKSVEYNQGLVILKFELTSAIFSEIKENGWFNFSENLFEADFPIEFQNGEISLVGNATGAEELHPRSEVVLNTKLWNILRFSFDGKNIESFLSLSLDGKISGSLTEAILDFSRKKFAGGNDLSIETKLAIDNLFSDLLEFSDQKNLNETSLQNLLIRLVSKIGGSEQKFELEAELVNYLNINSIPFEKEEYIYSFHVFFKEDHWDVAVAVSESKDRLIIFSCLLLEGSERVLESISEELETINQKVNIGVFELDRENRSICLKSEVLINLYTENTQIEEVMELNFDCMKDILDHLSVKFGDQLIFPD